MADLATFQRGFGAAMDRGGGRGVLARQPGFAVYRNTTPSALVAALGGLYPVTAEILGGVAFAQAAQDYARLHPPADPVLVAYGAGFGPWLAEQPWIAELPYLPAVAAVERLRGEAQDSADAPPLAWSHLEGLDADALAGLHPPLHPACRFAWLSAPAVTIWRAHQGGFETLSAQWRAEGVLITRPGLQVDLGPIDAPTHRLLFGLMLRECLGAAAAATQGLYPEADLASIFTSLVESGAFAVPASLERN